MLETIRAASWENRLFAYAKTKTQISFMETAKLISAFVFATRIVQSLYFLNTKFQASSHLLWLHSPVCVGPGQKPWRPVFSQWGSYYIKAIKKGNRAVWPGLHFLQYHLHFFKALLLGKVTLFMKPLPNKVCIQSVVLTNKKLMMVPSKYGVVNV